MEEKEKKKRSRVGDIVFAVLCLLVIVLYVGQKWLGWTW